MKASLLSAALLLGAAAPLPTPTSTPTPSPAAARNDPNRMICRHEDEIGTRLGGHRVCMTMAQWNEQEEQVHHDIDRAQAQRACTRGSGGC